MEKKKRSRKILHVLNSCHFSGAEHIVIDIIRSIPDENSFYVSRKGPIEDILKKYGIHYHLVDKLSVKSLSVIVKKVKPDLIHAHDFTASVCAALCFPRKTIISHLHNNVPWMKKIGLRSSFYMFTTLFYKKILVVSEAVKEEFIYRKLVERKICVIGNPINTEYITRMANERKEKCHWDMVFVGRLTMQKNLPLLLDILEALDRWGKNFTMAIIGEGEQERYLKEELERRKLQKHVTVMGFLENPYPVMKNSKILLLPSKWEGFGLVAGEALALGKPVVCSGVGGLDRIVDDTCGRKCSFDIKMYVGEIEKLMEDKSYYEKKSMGALIQAKKLDDFGNYIRQILEIYEIVI